MRFKKKTHVEVKVAGLVAVLGRDLDGGAGAVCLFVLEEKEERGEEGERRKRVR